MSSLLGETFRVTEVNKKSGERSSREVSRDELKKIRSEQLRKIRKEELQLTQKELADAIGVNLRTLQDWELGRNSASKPAELLMNVMRRHPEIRKELLAHKY